MGFRGIFSLLIIISTCSSFAADSSAWIVRKTSWSTADEQILQELVTNLGDAVASRRCNKVKECMDDESINFFASSDPSSINHYADCADLPYYLRTYVAWKRNLPFSYASSMSKRNSSDPRSIRYSRDGNKVATRRDLGLSRNPESAPKALRRLLDEVYTATFRTPVITKKREPLPDLYSVEISRESITPGVALYDSDGHAYVVYKVEANGNVKYIDAHPDGSLTLSEINNSFEVSREEHGWGFKKFRPQTLVGAQKIQDGNGVRYVGGQVRLAPDSEIFDYSIGHLSQKAGGDRKDNSSFYLFARAKLAQGDLKYDIIQEFSNMLDGLCSTSVDRAYAVDQAIAQGIDRQSHPSKLPDNIYGTTGDWESYSTPSRDARLKSAFVAGFEHVANLIQRFNEGDEKVVYRGSDVYQDLYSSYTKAVGSCTFDYKNSSGQNVELNLEDVRKRLFSISFDPYHCVERRWGAEGSELSSCREDSNKAAWYKAEQPLRNQIDRKYDDRMDYSLSELQKFEPNSGKGEAEPPKLLLIDKLKKYGDLSPR